MSAFPGSTEKIQVENGQLAGKVPAAVRVTMKPDFAFMVDQAGWPAFLVDDSGMVRLTNSAALDVFGTVMGGEPSLAATIWSSENAMNVEEFLGHLERSATKTAELQFKVKGGNTTAFRTLICPFQKGGKRFRLFQLLEPAATAMAPPPVAVAAAPVERPTPPPAPAPGPTIEAGVAQKQKLDCALQLIRTVALDFNNALTTIMGHTSLLLARAEPGHPWRSSLLQVERSAEKGAEIAQDLADFSRQEKDARTQAPGNMNSVVRHAVELFQGPGHPSVLWTMQLEKRLYTVTFDEAKMQQAFVRILENSVEAVGAEGRITVRTLNHTFTEPVVSPTVRLAAGHYVCVEISDNGSGIAADALLRVFEPFFSTKQDPKHRGLGLAWVYGIVTNHGGVVSISSEPGSSTNVRVFLPAQQKVVRDQGTKVEDLRGRETVLFVDDEEMVLNLGQTVLSAFGYKVITASSGQKALEIFQKPDSGIKLVVTDLVMPGMSGRELVDHLRRLEPKMPILRTSGFLRNTAEADAETYLRKPFTSQELLRRVRQLLGRVDPV